MFAVPESERVVAVYKLYAKKRPSEMYHDNAPFYVAGLCNVAFVRSARKTSSMCCLQLLQKLKYSLTGSLYRQICIARCVLLVSVAKRFDHAYLGKNAKSE